MQKAYLQMWVSHALAALLTTILFALVIAFGGGGGVRRRVMRDLPAGAVGGALYTKTLMNASEGYTLFVGLVACCPLHRPAVIRLLPQRPTALKIYHAAT